MLLDNNKKVEDSFWYIINIFVKVITILNVFKGKPKQF